LYAPSRSVGTDDGVIRYKRRRGGYGGSDMRINLRMGIRADVSQTRV
jgi:hypothetical protein